MRAYFSLWHNPDWDITSAGQPCFTLDAPDSPAGFLVAAALWNAAGDAAFSAAAAGRGRRSGDRSTGASRNCADPGAQNLGQRRHAVADSVDRPQGDSWLRPDRLHRGYRQP